MEKAWPPLKECCQYKLGLMSEAVSRYPWEKDGCEFDFSSYYPPIPEELASIRKLLDSDRNIPNGLVRFPEDIRDCPFCRVPDSVDLNSVVWDILKDPIWDMDPIPCPFHLVEHIWPFRWLTGRPPSPVPPKQLEDTNRYLKQVRNSRGYDVDCYPHPNLIKRQFWNADLNGEVGRKLSNSYKVELDSTAIPHINEKTGKVYRLDDILKIVSTMRRVTLVTFTAKAKDAARAETFIVTLGDNKKDDPIMECLLKPDCDAPGPDHYADCIIHPIKVPSLIPKGRGPKKLSNKQSTNSVKAVDHNEFQSTPEPKELRKKFKGVDHNARRESRKKKVKDFGVSGVDHNLREPRKKKFEDFNVRGVDHNALREPRKRKFKDFIVRAVE